MYEKFERLMKEKGVTPADVSKATGIGKHSYLIFPYTPLSPILGRIPPLISEAKVGDECRLFLLKLLTISKILL